MPTPGAFDSFITASQPFRVAAPKTGSTGGFDTFISAALPFPTYAAAAVATGITGTLSATLQAGTLAATATHGAAPPSATLAVTLQPATLAATGSLGAITTPTFYVDYANGNDTTGTGASGAPWKTLGKFLSSAANGDACRLRGGDVAGQHYYERNLSTSKTGLTIRNDTGHTPIFRATTATTGWTKTAGLTNVYEAADTDTNCFGVWNGATELATTASTAACDALTNSFFFDNPGDKLYVNIGGGAPVSIDRIPSAQGFLTAGGVGLTLDGLTYEYGFSGLALSAGPTVRNCSFRRFSANGTTRFAMSINGTGAIINNCTIAFTRLVNAAQGIIIESTAQSAAISDCAISGAFRGIQIVGGAGHTVDRCQMTAVYEDGVQCTGTAIVKDCVTAGFRHIGFQSRLATGNATYIRCISYIAAGHSEDGINGFVVEVDATGSFYHCIAANLLRGVGTNTRGFFFVTTAAACSVVNCIVYGCDNGIQDDTGSPGTKDYNCVYGNTANYVSLSPGPHDIQVDPQFVSPSSDDYHLQAGSPCRNAGLVIAGVNDGYSGSAPDIGTYELLLVVGTLSATLKPATLAATGTHGALPGRTGSLAVTLKAATLQASGGDPDAPLVIAVARGAVYSPAAAAIVYGA